jgi:hypothetical protein
VAAALLLAAAASSAHAQAAFFAPDTAFPITIRTDLRQLLRDRDPDSSEWRGGTVTWTTPDGPRTVPLRLRTRGLFRLRNCGFPPIRLRFAADSVQGTPWEDLRRPKLVTHCQNNDEAEENVLQEYVLYRVLRLFTPASLGARLVRITWEDATGSVRPVTRYGIVTEDPEKLADRLQAFRDTIMGIGQSELGSDNAALLGMFQYFIANTDWSAPSLHNIEILRVGEGYVAVPYDFDWSGVINASYARPAPVLRIPSVRVRVYRGRCQDVAALEPVMARFESLRDTVAALYRTVPGLSPRTVDRTLRYYDEFYRAIQDPPQFVRRVVEPTCMR